MELEQILLQTITEKIENLEATFHDFIKLNLAGIQSDSITKFLKECDQSFKRIEEKFSQLKVQIKVPPEMMEDYQNERIKLQAFVKSQEEAMNKKQGLNIKWAIAVSFLAFLLVWCVSVSIQLNNKLEKQNANDLKYQYLQTSALARTRYTDRLDSVYNAIGKEEFRMSLGLQKGQQIDNEHIELNRKK